jgi:hypothetical protein
MATLPKLHPRPQILRLNRIKFHGFCLKNANRFLFFVWFVDGVTSAGIEAGETMSELFKMLLVLGWQPCLTISEIDRPVDIYIQS